MRRGFAWGHVVSGLLLLALTGMTLVLPSQLGGGQRRPETLSWSLGGKDLRDLDLRGWDLRGANLAGATLVNVDLRGADLREANLSAARLERCDLRGARLRDADLWGIRLTRCDLRRTELPVSWAAEIWPDGSVRWPERRAW